MRESALYHPNESSTVYYNVFMLYVLISMYISIMCNNTYAQY